MPEDMLIRAFHYKAWADTRTHAAMNQIDAQSFANARAFTQQQLNHMCIVEELFRARLLGEAAPHEATNTDVLPPIDDLQNRQNRSNGWFLKYVTQLTRHQQNETISFVFADDKNGRMSRHEMLFHVVNHGTYHRGAISHALDLAGVPHPVDGYGIFAHEQEPERRLR